MLERQRTLKMAKSAHAYVRGNTLKFYEWLRRPARGTLAGGASPLDLRRLPSRQSRSLADANGHVEIQIRDLDQTVIGNPAHDLVRLGLSLTSAARGSNLPGVVTSRMLEEMVRGYAEGLSEPDSDETPPEPDAVRTVRRRALRSPLEASGPRTPQGCRALDPARAALLGARRGRSAPPSTTSSVRMGCVISCSPSTGAARGRGCA